MDMSVCMHDVQIHIYSCIDNQSEINGFKFGDHLHSFDVRCYLVLRVDHPTYETVMPSPYTHTHVHAMSDAPRPSVSPAVAASLAKRPARSSDSMTPVTVVIVSYGTHGIE